MRAEAAKALKTWATSKQLPTLLEMLKDGNVFAQHGAIAALGGLNEAKAADAVAALLPDFRLRMQASNALKEMGTTGEKATLPDLKHQDWAVRLEAVRILSTVGTKDTVAELRAAANDSNGLVRNEAAKALKTLEGR